MSQNIIFILPSLCIGGAELNTVRLSNEFIKQGHHVTILTIFETNQLSNRIDSAVTIHCLFRKRLFSSILLIRRYLNKTRPSIIYANLWPLTLIVFISVLLSRNQLKSLFIIEHIDLAIGLKKTTIFERCLEYCFHAFILPFLGGAIAVSPGVARSLFKNIPFFKPTILVIPNPIYKYGKLSKMNVKNFATIPKNLTIVAVGTLKLQKDYITMIQSINILVKRGINVTLKIAGDGPLLSELKFLVRALSLESNIQFLGFVNDPDFLYQKADLYLMTSAWEGFGNTLAEALSNGCRCVSTDCNSGPSYILGEGSYGTLARVGDPENIADSIIKELQVNRTINQFEKAVELFSIESVSKSYLKFSV